MGGRPHPDEGVREGLATSGILVLDQALPALHPSPVRGQGRLPLCGQESRHCPRHLCPRHLRVGQQQCGGWPGAVPLAGICTGSTAKPHERTEFRV